MKIPKSIAIIGAGTAGICAAKHSLAQGFDIVTIFEQGNQLGGTWIYEDRVGKNEHGLDVHSSMYKGLLTNLPKEAMGFPDFQLSNSDGKSYVTSEAIHDFLQSYAESFGVKNIIKFEHYVVFIKPTKADKWEIIVRDLKRNVYETFFYDFVFVCNGHHSVPLYPNYPGLELYKGVHFHSHDYKDAELYKDKSVLIVGAGFSGLDLVVQLSKVTKNVTISHHLSDNEKNILPKHYSQASDILKFTENSVEFIDGKKSTYDFVIFCTGFRYVFPFLSTECGIYVENSAYVRPLYKHIININNPTMAFIGLPDLVCFSQMMDLQVRFVLKYFTGEKKLPSKFEMLKETETEMNERWQKGYKLKRAHLMDSEQSKYYEELSRIAEIKNIRPVCVKLYDESEKHMKEDLENYRRYTYKVLSDDDFITIE